MLTSDKASALTPEQIERAKRLAATFPIELAEVRASQKQLRFQRVFFDRRDEEGRRVTVLVALGGNRSGKSICAGWLCFAKYLRDRARNGDTFWCVARAATRTAGTRYTIRSCSTRAPTISLGTRSTPHTGSSTSRKSTRDN